MTVGIGKVSAQGSSEDGLSDDGLSGDGLPEESLSDEQAMALALKNAVRAAQAGDVPVGAVLLDNRGRLISQGYNQRQARADPLSHAEIEALRAAGQVKGDWNLAGCSLIVTMEPCPMCAGAAVSVHLGRIVFGAWDPKMGACGSVWDIPRDPHVGSQPEVVGGILRQDCSRLLSHFFQKTRSQNE